MSRGHFIGLNKHRLMLADAPRMEAYRQAIEAQVKPGMRVMDLGTGTGILAMWAARAGAKDVVAVEPHDIARVATRLIEANGLSDQISVYQVTSQDLELRDKVDLVVTECMGNFFVTDEMQPVLRDLPRHMAPGAQTIPRRIRLKLAAATLPLWRELSFWDEPIGGLDFAAARAFARNAAYVVYCEPEFVATEVAVGADFPLIAAPDELTLEVDLAVTRSRTLHGLVGWFEADLGGGVVLDTGPGVRSHWGQMVFPLPDTPVTAGDHVQATVELLMDSELRSTFRWRGTIHRQAAPDVPFTGDTARRFEA